MSKDLLGGRYQLQTVLGRGGMAAVWRGVDTRLARPVAVKVLDEAALADPAAGERFDREARTVARLNHPHVVAVYDVGSDNSRRYLVMELVEGTSLATLLAAGPLDVARAVRIAAETCDALDAAHAGGVVHRDVKPGNILIDAKGAVKVCDFGIARLVGAAQPTLTGAGAAIGTSQYMAPEQVAGGPVDARTDLYALGCVLYAMLTGAPPFTGDGPVDIAVQHLHREPEPVSHRRPDVPPMLAALIGSLLTKDPNDRPQTAGAVSRALLDLSRGLDISAIPPTAPHAAIRGTAAVMPRTQTMPVQDVIGDFPPPPPRRMRPRWAGAATVAVIGAVLAAVLVAVLAKSPDNGAAPPGGDAAPTSAAAPAGDSTGAERQHERPADLVAAAQEAVATQAAAGQIDAKAAEQLGKELDQIQEALAEGKDERLAEKSRDVEEKLAELRKEGKITDAGWAAVHPPLTRLTADLPTGDGSDD